MACVAILLNGISMDFTILNIVGYFKKDIYGVNHLI